MCPSFIPRLLAPACVCLLASTAAMPTYAGASFYAIYPTAVEGVEPVTLALSDAILPPGSVAEPYQFDFRDLLTISAGGDSSATGASWKIVQGDLPKGLTLSSEGVISGVPEQAVVTGVVTVEATYKNQSAQRVFPLPVISAFTLAAATLPRGEQGFRYSYNLAPLISNGGASPSSDLLARLSWSVRSGALPPGLTLSSAGLISGIPTTVSTFSAVLGATYGATTSEQAFTVTIPAKQTSGYVENQIFFSRGQSNGSCWAKWGWGGSAVTQAGLLVSNIGDCYVDYGGYRYRPYGARVKILNDGYQNYEYYGISRQLY